MTSETQSMRARWEAAHETPQFRPKYPHEQVVRWAFRNFRRTASPQPRILDVGCGAGRHAIFLAAEGFDTCACDISEVGLRELQLAASSRGVSIQTHRTSGHDLSHYADGTFDGVLSFGVIYYMSATQAEQTFREIFRVLRAGGRFLCVLRSDADSRIRQATQVARSTWRINKLEVGAPSDMEDGMEMLFYSREDVERAFSKFTGVAIDRMIYIHDDFANDDWLIEATKP